MKYFITIVLLVCSFHSYAQQRYTLYSPDSLLRIELAAAEKLSYVLYAGNTKVAASSSIDLQLSDGETISGGINVVKKKQSIVNENIIVPVAYRRRQLYNRYNEISLWFSKPFSVEFRMYNNGMAYRIGTDFKDSITITNETAYFDIDKNAAIWFAHIDKRNGMDRFHTSFEGVYKKEILSAIPDTMITYPPVTLSLNNGYHLAITDANLFDYPGMFLQQSATGLQAVFAPYPANETMTDGEFPQLIVTERKDFIARTSGKRMLPWRVVMLAKNDIELPANDLVYLLGDPSKIKDPSWIKTGKGTDEWITGINLFNVPFKAGINTASYKYYIDFAKRFGFNQIMLDAGWSDYKDLFKINPDIDMEELVTYSASKGIRLMLWTLCSTLDKQLDSALIQFNKWGVQSIMTDFMDRDDQKMVNFYHRIAKACAEHKISIMFHGAFPPKGFNRTWPNAITQEGTLGAEWNIWSDLATPEHNVTLAYTRMLAGPLDYEPGLLLNAQKDQFRAIGKNPMSQGTRCHQLAMFVTYDSPLQIFSGNISQGLLEPEFMELLGSIPTTWDDTKILQGKIGEHIITARRKGNVWFVSGLNGTNARTIELSLDFLDSDSYKLVLCRDGENAHNYGSDYWISNPVFEKAIKINMAAGGGFLLKLSKN